MSNTMYFIAFILVGGWSLGYFDYAQGGLIHVILVIGLAQLILSSAPRKKYIIYA